MISQCRRPPARTPFRLCPASARLWIRSAKNLPDDMQLEVQYDSTEYVQETIKEIIVTLFMTLALVIFVCYLFLQDWRTTLVPTVAIPVSLLGTFAALLAVGYTINTLFALRTRPRYRYGRRRRDRRRRTRPVPYGTRQVRPEDRYDTGHEGRYRAYDGDYARLPRHIRPSRLHDGKSRDRFTSSSPSPSDSRSASRSSSP